jgi:hypothetical protein
MLGHHQAYRNVETLLMNGTLFTLIWMHIDIVLNFALILRLKLSNIIVNKHDLSQFKGCLMGKRGEGVWRRLRIEVKMKIKRGKKG